MCLYLEKLTPTKARKDITVYKVLNKYTYKQRTIYSTFWRVLGVPDNGILIPKEEKVDIVANELYGGAIHSFKDIKGAKRLVARGGSYTKIFKAVIPKGTLYYEGTDSMYEPGYASLQLNINLQEEL